MSYRGYLIGSLIGFIVYYTIYFHLIKVNNSIDKLKENIITSPNNKLINREIIKTIDESLANNQVKSSITTKIDENKNTNQNELIYSNEIWCANIMKAYQIKSITTLNDLPIYILNDWNEKKCYKYIKTSDSTKSPDRLQVVIPSKQPNTNTININKQDIEKQDNKQDNSNKYNNALSNEIRINKEWCVETARKYNVKPLKSWGQLPADLMVQWKSKHCDKVFTNIRMNKRPISSCTNDNRNLNESLPLIAIMAATTTRKVDNPSPSNLALFIFLLPSLVRSLDCGYRYVYVLGYDATDPFYDSNEGMDITTKWFFDNVENPMRKNGIIVKLLTVKVNNSIKKPGPVFIAMARESYNYGANYFYRVNDDTELLTTWPKAFVQAIESLGPPYGVVGPKCQQGNDKILTHDFVHRLHLDIFDMNYYPPELVDWWMDDWISWVYGNKRTFKAQQHPVIHHTGAHGQRYQVNHDNEKNLKQLVKSGHNSIRNYILKSNLPEKILRDFDQDNFRPGYQFNDLPNHI